MCLSFSLGAAAESPWGFYSPPHHQRNFPPHLRSQLAGSWRRLCLSSSACYWEMCFLPHRSLSSIITGGGLENDSSRQLLLTVWGLKANSTLPGKQGWWWPLLPKVCALKNGFPPQFRGGLSGSRADLIIQLCLFSRFFTEKMQFFRNIELVLAEIIHRGLTGSVVLAYSAIKCILLATQWGALCWRW